MKNSAPLTAASLMTTLQNIEAKVGVNLADMGLVYRLDETQLQPDLPIPSPAGALGVQILDEVDWILREGLPDGITLKIQVARE